MRVKIVPSSVHTIIKGSQSQVYAQGDQFVYALNPLNAGQLRIRIKPPSDPYAAQQYWFCTIQFEKGLRPHRFYDSAEVRDFVKNYVFHHLYPGS